MVESIKGASGAPLGSISNNSTAAGSKDTFGSLLKESITKVNDLQNDADKAMQGLAKGEVKNIHDTMIAIEKANLSFNLMVQVRNKLLSAYEEIMKTQV